MNEVATQRGPAHGNGTITAGYTAPRLALNLIEDERAMIVRLLKSTDDTVALQFGLEGHLPTARIVSRAAELIHLRFWCKHS